MSTTSEDPGGRGSAAFNAVPNSLGAALARNWWLIALRGVLGLVFGLLALILPFATILALVLLFSAYMLVDGVFAIYAAVRAARQRENWGFLAFQRAASIVTAVLLFFLPGPPLFPFLLHIPA